ncbi:protein of unknown function [Vibrio tapetis subsp. tapetis]|uniref:Uncharacterized protein n=1 Tax=Vibrio tapetis subsp. tapetis TaxID=1671868 RepID=A0A2N8ZJI8_9VIBR|nr:protein of unknown function [Vibrio tapetis subsp. tapetis]
MTELIFFRTQEEFSLWLKNHHNVTTELWVGFYKKTLTEPVLLGQILLTSRCVWVG